MDLITKAEILIVTVHWIDWWSEEDLENFESKSKKLIDQFNQYKVLDSVPINGSITLGENIADLGGLEIALEAYQYSLDGKSSLVIDGFTGEQRVFLGYAQVLRSKMRDEALLKYVKTDTHAPKEHRVNGVVRNVTEFYTLFNVKPGDTLYLPPSERVKIW